MTIISGSIHRNEFAVVDVPSDMIEKECELWQESLLLKYEDGKIANIQKICSALNLNNSATSIFNHVERIPFPKYRRDLVSEFHPGHITNSSWRSLDQKLIEDIEITFNWWFSKHGYTL